MERIDTVVFDAPGCLVDEQGRFYEDVIPVLVELRAMGVEIFLASPELACEPARAIYLTATESGLKTAKAAGFHAVLMMNDPDESRRLAMLEPAGGIVSLHELPDFLRLVAAQNR